MGLIPCHGYIVYCGDARLVPSRHSGINRAILSRAPERFLIRYRDFLCEYDYLLDRPLVGQIEPPIPLSKALCGFARSNEMVVGCFDIYTSGLYLELASCYIHSAD